jgi:hypothetical protein
VKRALILAGYIAIALAHAALGQEVCIPGIPPNDLQTGPIVIKFGNGGRIEEHRQQFVSYQRHRTQVEIRGPCYSACTLVLAYVGRDYLCIAPGAFMAFHAVRSMERGAVMVAATQEYYASLPLKIQKWIRDNGGYENLPLNGYWTMYDHELWAMGYPKCN